MTRTVRRLACELLERDRAEVGEGPAWDAATESLIWVDITAGTVRRTSASGERLATHAIGRHVGAALPAADGRLLLAVREGFALLDPSGTAEPLLEVEPDPSMRFNDAKCDPHGRAFAGTMPYVAKRGVACLYRLDTRPNLRATPVIEAMALSNGLAWSADGELMWVIDSGPGTVTAYAYDAEDGSLGGVVSSFRPRAGEDSMPDGMCIDDDGGLWIAVWGDGEVRRYTPTGRLDAVVELPVTQVTSCCFGGSGGDTLFITSAAFELTPAQLAEQPLAGSLFAVSPGATGRPATPWAGAP